MKKMKERTASYQADKLEFIKNPVIAEFLDLASNADFMESELEQRIITHIQKFLMEMGKGYAFVARIEDEVMYISNACVFPSDWTTENLMKTYNSRPYNPDLANTFFRAGYIESWGRGFKIFVKNVI